MSDQPDLEFFFDPICPFAWITSRWVEEVATLKHYDVRWRFISLAVINDGKDYGAEFPPGYPALHGLGRDLLRVCAAARAEHGEAAGRGALHGDGRAPPPGRGERRDLAGTTPCPTVSSTRSSSTRVSLLVLADAASTTRGTTCSATRAQSRCVAPAATSAHRS